MGPAHPSGAPYSALAETSYMPHLNIMLVLAIITSVLLKGGGGAVHALADWYTSS